MSWSRSASCWLLSALVSFGACARRHGPALQIVGESVKLTRDAALPATSAIFDGRTVRLRGARGETLGVQVIFSGAARDVTLAIAPARVDAFRVHFLDVREPSTDMYGPSRGAGAYPDPLEPVADGAVGAAEREAYFDVVIPRDAAPGHSSGELRAGADRFPVELTIDAITIDVRAAPLVWVAYDPAKLAAAHAVADDDGPAELALEQRYQDLFRAHGAYLASDLPPRRFTPRRAFAAGIAWWPVGLDLHDDAALVASVRDTLGAFAGTGVTPFVIPIDEPAASRRAEVAAKARAIHAAAAGGSLLTAVTDEDRPEYAGAIDVLISPNATTGTGAPHWTYNGRPPRAGSMIIDGGGVALRTWGWIAYRYGVPLWYAWDGLYWSDSNNRRAAGDMLRDPVTFRSADERGNGDGVLAYPHVWPSLRLEALRRGLEDRLLLARLGACAPDRADALARRVVPRALGEAPKTAAPAWPDDEAAFEAARAEILDALRACAD